MPGRMGTDRVTVQNLKILKVFPSWLVFPARDHFFVAVVVLFVVHGIIGCACLVLLLFPRLQPCGPQNVSSCYMRQHCPVEVSCMFHGIYLPAPSSYWGWHQQPPGSTKHMTRCGYPSVAWTAFFPLLEDFGSGLFPVLGFVSPKRVLTVCLFFLPPGTRAQIDPARELLFVRGHVPGQNGGFVRVTDAIK